MKDYHRFYLSSTTLMELDPIENRHDFILYQNKTSFSIEVTK